MATKIYVLSDPATRQIRYVGQTRRTLKVRIQIHLAPSSLRYKTHKNNWLKDLLGRGERPEIELVEEHETEDAANEAEKFFISYFKFIGCSLTNTIDGGGGPTWAAARKISAKQKGVKRGATAVQREQLKRLHESLRGRPMPAATTNAFNAWRSSPAYKERVARVHQKNLESGAYEKRIAEMTAAKLGVPKSAEHRAKISATLKARHQRLLAERAKT